MKTRFYHNVCKRGGSDDAHLNINVVDIDI